MNFIYLLYSLLLIIIFQLSKNIKSINYIVVSGLILSFFANFFSDSPQTKYKGWDAITFIKQFFLYIAICAFLLKSKKVLKYGNYLVFISLLFMFGVLIFPRGWDATTSSWVFKKPVINISTLLLSIYVLKNSLKLNFIDSNNLSWFWIFIQNILLTLVYSSDQWKSGKTGNLFIISLWIPMLLYPKDEYFYFRSIGIALPNIWKGLSPSTLNYLIR